MTKAVFLDRDGVINRKALEGQYVTRWEDFDLLPGVIEAIAELNRAGLSVFVVTNQRCVAKGLATEDELKNLHRQMSEHFRSAGATVDAIYYCPHDLEPPCSRRKPSPGMLLDAARSHGLDLRASWMIGDSESNIQAGKSAGCKTVRLLTEQQASHEQHWSSASPCDADLVAASLPEAIQQILQSSNL
jgi:D-glycero-D-manno-heptose 1,7-bisphosphate phosphatase